MLSLTNRDYQSILEDLKAEVQKLTEDWTDFSDSDIGMVWLKTLAGLSSMLHYYIDKQANESYIGLAREAKNVESILELLGYRRPLRVCAKSTAHFRVNLSISEESRLHNDVVIPKHTFFYSRDKKLVAVSAEGFTITPETSEFTLPLYLAVPKSKSYANKYLTSYKFYLPKENIVEDEFSLYIDGVEWERVENAFLELEGGRKYSIHRDSYDSTYILFTHNFTDYVSTGGNFTLSYLVADIIEAPKQAITSMDYIPITTDGVEYPSLLSLSYVEPFIGGFNESDTLLERARLQRQAKSLNRIVTLEDYRNFVLTKPGVYDCEVADMSVEHTTNPKPYEIDIFVLLPIQEGILSTMSTFFREELEQEIEARHIFGNKVFLKDANLVTTNLDISYYVRDAKYLTSNLSYQISEYVRKMYSSPKFQRPVLVEEIVTNIITHFPQVYTASVNGESLYPKIGECIVVESVSVRGFEYNVRP